VSSALFCGIAARVETATVRGRLFDILNHQQKAVMSPDIA
jgi:hypothetical protein